MPYLGATSLATKFTRACSAWLPSAVTTVSVAPGTSLGDLVPPNRFAAISEPAMRTAAPAPRSQGSLRRLRTVKPWSCGDGEFWFSVTVMAERLSKQMRLRGDGKGVGGRK